MIAERKLPYDCRDFARAVIMREGLQAKAIAGRGNGLVATRCFAVGERVCEAAAFGFAQYLRERECCAHCLRFGGNDLLRCAGGCPTRYCSEECQRADALSGHGFACGALKRIEMLRSGKNGATIYVRSSAEFLLRAFAARRAAAGAASCSNPADALPEDPSAATFEQSLAQCRDDPRCMAGYEAREAEREAAIQLASLHGGELIPRKRHGDAMQLLRSEHCNSYCWRDDLGHVQGWAMYPKASLFNHSCLPNTAYVADGRRLIFEAIRPIAIGEELSHCYVRLPVNDGTAEWGFTCVCERCSGSASVEALAAFDQAHLCVCGAVVTAAMKAATQAVAGGPACRCETHNRVGRTTQVQ